MLTGLRERRKSQVVAQERRDFGGKMEAFERDLNKPVRLLI